MKWINRWNEQKSAGTFFLPEIRSFTTGRSYPIKICILWSCDNDGFDMAAGVNLCDVRIEETLKIRIGKFLKTSKYSSHFLEINLEILQGRPKIYSREKNQDIHATVTAL